MANENSQEQLVEVQGTKGHAQESTDGERKALDQTLESIRGSDKDASQDVQVALDRIQLLEHEHIELMSLVQYVYRLCHSVLHS